MNWFCWKNVIKLFLNRKIRLNSTWKWRWFVMSLRKSCNLFKVTSCFVLGVDKQLIIKSITTVCISMLKITNLSKSSWTTYIILRDFTILFKVYFQRKITIITAASTTTKIVKTFELKKNCRTDYFDLLQTTNIHWTMRLKTWRFYTRIYLKRTTNYFFHSNLQINIIKTLDYSGV